MTDDLQRELERLRALEARLPRTADGVAVIPTMDLVWRWYAPGGGDWEQIICPNRHDSIGRCYFHRENAPDRGCTEA